MKNIKKWRIEILAMFMILIWSFVTILYIKIDLQEFREILNTPIMFNGKLTLSNNALLGLLWFIRLFNFGILVSLIYGLITSIINEKRWEKYEKIKEVE